MQNCEKTETNLQVMTKGNQIKNFSKRDSKPVKQDSNTLKKSIGCIQKKRSSLEGLKQANFKSSQAWRNCQVATSAFQGLARVICEQLAPIGTTVTLTNAPVKFVVPN